MAPCIYCRALDVPRTREHVVQAALGGSLTLPTQVCADCNAAFSPLDKDLVDHVNLFALGKVSHLLGLGLQDDPAGVRLTARMGRKGEESGLAVAPPQVFRDPTGRWQFRGRSVDALETMTRELSRPTANVTEIVDRVDDGGPPVALAVVHTGRNAFIVRGSDEPAVRDLAAKIRETGMQITSAAAAQTWTPPAEVAPIAIQTSFPVGRVARCLAKIALNYVCNIFGEEVALGPAFDRARRFARYGEGGFIDFVTLEILDHGQQEAMRMYCHPSKHALVINEYKKKGSTNVALAQVILYGRAIGVVRLAESALPILPTPRWRVTYFDHEQRTFEHLMVPDDGLRCFVNIEAVVPGAGTLKE